MSPSVDDAAFSIRFTVTDPTSYDELHLGLADHVVFNYTMVRAAESSALRGQHDTLWFKDGAAPVLLTPELVARASS